MMVGIIPCPSQQVLPYLVYTRHWFIIHTVYLGSIQSELESNTSKLTFHDAVPF